MSLLLAFVLCLAAISTASAYPPFQEECLNYTVYPVEYELTITPRVHDGHRLYYDGSVIITVIANAPGIRVIELDAQDMEVSGGHVEVWYGGENIIDSRPFDYDKQRGKIYLYLKEDMHVYGAGQDHKYRIGLSFRKFLSVKEHAYKEESIFFSRYDENNIGRYMIATRLHPDRAKAMFPCFNNPLFQSVYKIVVNLPPDRENPNMIIGPTSLTIASEAKRQMSKYNYTVIEYLSSNQIAPHQIGFHLSHYINRQIIATKANDVIVVWAPRHAIDDYSYILNLGANLVNILYRYSAEKRPITNGPINLVPIPEFIEGYEIDSWNLLTNGEHRMHVVDLYTSAHQKEQMSFELAQQLSRVWLGNPGEAAVTRWGERWFKEGMATYLACVLMSKLSNTYWDVRIYGFQSKTEAMDVDWRETFYPLGHFNKTLGVHLTSRDRELISAKTAAILFMVENWMTSQVFHTALQYYIESRRGQFISVEDFANFLQTEIIKCEFFKGYTVSDVLNSWINQPGYPLVHVKVYRSYNDTDVIGLEQKHFTFNNNLRKDYNYKVPISYTTLHEENCFSCNQPKFIIGDKPYHFKENIGEGWIILNRNASGYYRVNYDMETWRQIVRTLTGPQRTIIDEYNRAQIVNDAFALYVAGEIDYSLAVDILDCLDHEDSFVVWDSAFAGYELLKVESAAVGMSKQLYDKWEKIMRDKIAPVYKRMASELERDHQTRIFRSRVIEFACQVGHKPCLGDLEREIGMIRRSEAYDPDLRRACYYELQKRSHGWQVPAKRLNQFEKDDMSNAKNKILRERDFRNSLPETLASAAPMILPPSNIIDNKEVTSPQINPATSRPSSATTIRLAVIVSVMSAICVNILR